MCLNTFMKLHTIPRICIQYCLNSFYRKCSVNYSHALFYNVECKLKYLQILLFNANLPVKRLVLCYFHLEWILVAKTHYKNSSTFDKLSFAFSNDTAKNHFFCCWNFQTKLVTFFFFPLQNTKSNWTRNIIKLIEWMKETGHSNWYGLMNVSIDLLRSTLLHQNLWITCEWKKKKKNSMLLLKRQLCSQWNHIDVHLNRKTCNAKRTFSNCMVKRHPQHFRCGFE